MKPPQPPQNISDWLAIATKGLCVTAQARIAQEIESHFTEAVAAHMAEGHSQSGAHDLALAELGSPQRASPEFRRKHLTIREADYVGKLLHPKTRKGLVFGYCLTICMILVLDTWFPEGLLLVGSIAFLNLAIFSTIAFYISAYVPAKTRVVPLMIIDLVQQGVVYFSLLFVARSASAKWWLCAVLVVAFAWWIGRLVLIGSKIRRTGYIETSTPTPV